MSDHMGAMEQCIQWKRERDEALAEIKELESAHELAVHEMDRMWTERDAAEAQRDALLDLLRGKDMDTVLRIAEGYLYGDPPTKPDPIVRPAAARIRETLTELEE